ncbi:GAF sensor signal transduction histidine kinase [Gloeocapsa sp. PCC 7428]|uniref:GAF domain-containing hybrid sensor histidine kinase/response regulator n=1 Tax=Gloeocapsa sp. PCC 7428 TaxID=1173026 RepID=UPI0002A5BCBB|nr:ATP-binding protein [Gloeocapsa sp. PCC 7428]AFZ33124.1 GAF sensor signal transduction histidine kinase [Gloeocapsa sp. PCC 7428]
MNVNANYSQPSLSVQNLDLLDTISNPLATIGAELAFIQNADGCYLAFYWQQAKEHGITDEQITGTALDEIFTPVNQKDYREKLQRVIQSAMPEQSQCLFRCAEKLFFLDIILVPVLTASAQTNTVLVMGRSHEGQVKTANHATETFPRLKKQLTQIARNIRRTLDLDIIWQQAVDSLGKALGATQCIIYSYLPEQGYLRAVAEYTTEPIPSTVGLEFAIAQEPSFCQALATLQPIVIEKTTQQVQLIVATCYQDQPNGLISLVYDSTQRDRDCPQHWSVAETDLVGEVADQIGTAIAHATLYKELELARQQAEEASRLKSEFLANTSHEIRTPLNGMIGFLKLILEGMADDPQEQQEFIQEAYSSAIHLLDIINDILDIAKIEAGKMELELGPVKLDELFVAVEEFTRTQAEQKNLSFHICMPDTSDEIILHGNYQRLKQVLLNLVSNALKFTHEGGITINADVVRKKFTFQNQEFPGLVKVRVADTGIGVSLDKQDKLFQSFSQVDGSRTRQYGGTGLGLTISQKLVEAMGGTVNFYSMGEGLGSTVTFTVPLYQVPVMVSIPTEDFDV